MISILPERLGPHPGNLVLSGIYDLLVGLRFVICFLSAAFSYSWLSLTLKINKCANKTPHQTASHDTHVVVLRKWHQRPNQAPDKSASKW
jgi:hypothetical protein